MDKIHIKEILLRAIVGINADERINKQDVVISITMHADLSKACKTDDVTDTIDYSSVKKRVTTLVENSEFFLIEKLAQAIANICLEDDRVKRVDVSVEKPGALRFARTVGVEISRSRD
jgi:D-erythro-7,8-dihydroneopterin triphosphate epimerase